MSSKSGGEVHVLSPASIVMNTIISQTYRILVAFLSTLAPVRDESSPHALVIPSSKVSFRFIASVIANSKLAHAHADFLCLMFVAFALLVLHLLPVFAYFPVTSNPG
jgi:hypothetical protein